ncbi:unnamed protein product [Parajaminaea phylloscopi]
MRLICSGPDNPSSPSPSYYHIAKLRKRCSLDSWPPPVDRQISGGAYIAWRRSHHDWAVREQPKSPQKRRRPRNAAMDDIDAIIESFTAGEGSTRGPNSTPDPAGMASRRRIMGVSCDACKLRKVKCDRNQRAEATCDSEAACTNCLDHQLACVWTKPTVKATKGRRLQELRRSRPPQATPASDPRPPTEGHAEPKDFAEVVASSSWKHSGSVRHPFTPVSWVATAPASTQVPTMRFPGLFQVKGLTRPLLDECVVAYFKWGRISSQWVRGRDFSLRYRAFFDCYNGLQPTVEPVSELLILGVAAAGAGLLENPAAIGTDIDKFELQGNILARFLTQTKQLNWNELTDAESVDLVNASYVCSYLALESGQDEEDEGPEINPYRTPAPLSDEMLASFVFKAKLNRAAKLEERAPADGARWRTGRGAQLLTDEEVGFRIRTFLSLYTHDAIRSIMVGRPHLYTDQMHDVDLNSLVQAPYDPGFSPAGPGPAIVSVETESRRALELPHLIHLRRLGTVAREIGPPFCSVSSQNRGIPNAAIVDGLSSLLAWYRDIPPQSRFEHWVPSDWRRGKDARPEGYQLQRLLSSIWMELLLHGILASIMHLSFKYGVRADPGKSDQETGALSVWRACFDSLSRVARICRVGGTLHILRCSPVVCRNLPTSYALWACEEIRKSKEGKDNGAAKGRPPSDELLVAVKDIIFGVSTVDSAKDTPSFLHSLQQSLNAVQTLDPRTAATAADEDDSLLSLLSSGTTPSVLESEPSSVADSIPWPDAGVTAAVDPVAWPPFLQTSEIWELVPDATLNDKG